jgi:hypothetical protein
MATIVTHSDAPEPACDGPVPTPGGPLSYIHGGPVIAGAITAAAVSFVFMTFASAVGLAVASPSPTWRETSIGLVLLSGFWILMTALGSFVLGGYIAGRVRSSWSASADEIEFRDGLHGLLVWALAVVLAGLLTWATATAISTATAVSSVGSGGTSARSGQDEPAFLSYELDRLFRSERQLEAVDPEARAEAGRILLRGIGRGELSAEDRTYLTRLVAMRTGLAPPDADRRVSQVLAEARQSARRARASAIIIGFLSAASLAVGAAAAWLAAVIGGRHRDQAITPPLRWGWRRSPA